MQTVEVTARLEAPRTAVEAALSPRSIVEYERTYEVREIRDAGERSGSGEDERKEWIVIADAESDDSDLVTKFRIEERPDGYEYEQTDRGPFEHLRTTVTLEENGDGGSDDVDRESDGGARETVVTMRSRFTFGGWLAPVIDRLARRSRRDELDRAVVALAQDVSDASDAE